MVKCTGNPTAKHIEFTYDAAGIKLYKKTNDGTGNTTEKNYVGGIEYVDNGGVDEVEAIYHSEGRLFAQYDGNNILVDYQHEYTIKDHLGNARVSFSDLDKSGKVEQSEVLQTNHYYPFGLVHEGNQVPQQGPENMYQFNGTERIKDFELDWNHTQFRTYDNALGRWHQIDPKNSERESGYVGLGNNPVIYSDLLGDTTHIFYTDGTYYTSIYGKEYNTEIHFIGKGINPDITGDPDLDVSTIESMFRASSNYYIGANTMDKIEDISKDANDENLERPFIFYYTDNSRELQVIDGTDFLAAKTDGNGGPGRTANKIHLVGDFKGKVDNKLSSIDETATYVGYGHIHPKAALKKTHHCSNCNRYNKPSILNKPTKPGGLSSGASDFSNPYKIATAYPSIVATSHGITVYASARSTTMAEWEKTRATRFFPNDGIAYSYAGKFLHDFNK